MSDYNVNPYNPQNVTPLRFFVQAVLPLVYDDSLSYYEVLSKIAHKLNEVITSLDQNNIQVTEITNAYNAFVEYITNREIVFEENVDNRFNLLSTQLLNDIHHWETGTYTNLQNQYNNFLENYQRSFGVSQSIGNSTTDVMSQNAIRNYTILSMGVAESENIDTIENNTVYFFGYEQVISGDNGTFPPNCGTCTVMTIASPKSLQAGITQILSDYANGVIWVRQKKTIDDAFVWQPWVRSISFDEGNNLFVKRVGSLDSDANVDTQETNTICTYPTEMVSSGTSGTFPDGVTTNCMVTTFSHLKGDDVPAVQMCYVYNTNTVYYRFRSYNEGLYNWSDWLVTVKNAGITNQITDQCVTRVGSLPNDANVDTQETNTICTYPSEMVASGTNGTFPEGVTTNCMVTTFSHLKGDDVPAVQMCYVYNTNAVYYRFRSYIDHEYLWSDWVRAISFEESNNLFVKRVGSLPNDANVDEQETNTICTYPTEMVSSGTNGTFPDGVTTNCMVTTFSHLKGDAVPAVQMCYVYNTNAVYYRFRSYNGRIYLWSDWVAIQSNPLPAVQNCYTDTVQNLRCTTTDIRGKKIYTLYIGFDDVNFSNFSFGNVPGREGFVINVDDTNVSYRGERFSKTYTHGLTIQNFVSLSIVANDDDTADCTLITNGGAYSWTIDNWGDNLTEVSLLSTPLTINEFKISVTPLSSNRPVIIFGDSYLSDWDTRWGYYLLHSKLDNYGVSAYGGKNSMAAYASFNALLNFNIPKCVIWAMGMNDPDNGTVNANWQAYYNNVKSKCKKYGIKLILCTIPNGKNHDNTYKNAIIRNTPDFIDLASAVQDDQGNWYTDMQDADGVHTTALGAKAIFNKFLSGYPYTI